MATRNTAIRKLAQKGANAKAAQAREDFQNAFSDALGGGIDYIAAKDAAELPWFAIASAGERVGRDMKGNPQDECFYDIVTPDHPKPRRLTLAKTERRARLVEVANSLVEAGKADYNGLRLVKWIPEGQTEGYWTFRAAEVPEGAWDGVERDSEPDDDLPF